MISERLNEIEAELDACARGELEMSGPYSRDLCRKLLDQCRMLQEKNKWLQGAVDLFNQQKDSGER